MIIKIVGTNEGNAHWWMFDNVATIQHYQWDGGQETVHETDADWHLFDPGNNKETFMLACCRPDGTKLRILTNLVAYLCNDKGDTIDVVRARPQD